MTVSLLSHSCSKMEAVMKAHTSKHHSRDCCCGYKSSPGRHQPCLRSQLISHTVPGRHRSWPWSPDPQLHHDYQARFSTQWDDMFNVKSVQINTKTLTERKERHGHSRDVHPLWSPGQSDHIIPEPFLPVSLLCWALQSPFLQQVLKTLCASPQVFKSFVEEGQENIPYEHRACYLILFIQKDQTKLPAAVCLQCCNSVQRHHLGFLCYCFSCRNFHCIWN